MAVELVQLAAGFCLPVTPNLLERVQQEFELTEEQRWAFHQSIQILFEHMQYNE